MKNPKECFSIVEQKTFIVNNELCVPSCEDGSEPLLFHHKTFSRFGFVIINQDKRPSTANVPVSSIPGIFYEMDLALKKMTETQAQTQTSPPSASAEGQQGPAYTVQIRSGMLRGQTPAQVLAADPKNRIALINQANWLKENLAKYPANQSQIDAIVQAVRLFDTGRLQTSAVTPAASSGAGNAVYASGMRPLIRRQRADGKCFVYEISISCGTGERPVEFRIRNYYAPVRKMESGLLNVMAREMDRATEVNNTFRMSVSQWMWLRHILETQIRTFEDLNSASLYKTANDAAAENRYAALAAAR